MKLPFILALFAMILLCGNTAVAQGKLKKAREYKNNFEFSKALELYMEIYEHKDPKSDQDIRDIAHCFRMINDTESAQNWLAKITGLIVYRPDDMMNFAMALKSAGKYDETVRQLKRYAQLFPNNSDQVKAMIDQCDSAKFWIKNPQPYLISNMEKINSENSDFGLTSYPDGYLLSSDRRLANKKYSSNEIFGWTGNPFLSLYSIKDISNQENEVVASDEINSDHHNGPAVFDYTTGTLYYSVAKLYKAITKVSGNTDPTSWVTPVEQEQFINRIEIYSAQYKNHTWTKGEPFKYNNVEVYSAGHPAITADGKVLYFSSDMPGGVGKSDIYYCEKNADGSWSEPKNAGKNINTEEKEVFPFIDKDGNLYFASDGHPGMGGLDLFKAVGRNDSWSKPENLKYPINSSKDDFSIFVVKTDSLGYFSSNRDGGKGSDDIYSFNYITTPPIVTTQTVLAVTTYERLENGTLASLEDVDVHYHENAGGDAQSIEPSSQGIYFATVYCDTRYMINGAKTGYFVAELEVETECKTKNDTVHVQLILNKIIINKPILIKNIYYDYNKWDIRPDAAAELDKIVHLLQENPQIIIELGSHTDSRGTDIYNKDLSQKRAVSAVNYIVSNGISKSRITAKGYGESVLLNKCDDGVKCSEIEHQMNRRTEFKVIGFNLDQPVIYNGQE